jgi:UDP-glucose 4-epimerase
MRLVLLDTRGHGSLASIMALVLVTGGAGFVGAAVVAELERAGDHVSIIGRGVATDALNADRISTALTPRPDLVIHCAGGSSVAASVEHPEYERAKTVEPFAALLECIRERAPRARVVLVSSAAVYGTSRIVPTPETAPIEPVSPYGEHKRTCEVVCEAHARAGHPAAIVRLFSIYGPGLRKQLLWDACHKALAGKATFAGTGDEQRDWLHVTDAAALITRVAGHASSELPVVNGGAGVGVRVRDVVTQIGHELGATPIFTGERRQGDPERYIADISRARALGWSPRVELGRGIADYVAWFRANA